tara:strand:+ start:1414 stop:2370 length:957 start_codon:yes stop_codon:yes gene_type:complete
VQLCAFLQDENPMPKTDSPRLSSKQQPKHKSGWVIPVIALFCLGPLLFLVLIVLGTGLGIQGSIGGFGGMQMATAQYTPKDVVGDLGGMPVTIPRHMAEFVEYEGDPGWGQKRKGPIPERTHESKLTSFGVQFRYPDMATLSSPAMWQDKNSKSIYNTDWMSIGVSAGTNYPGDAWLNRWVGGNIQRVEMDRYIYKQQTDKLYGLTKYLKINKDTGEADEKMNNIDGLLLVKADDQGAITTYIECSTVQHFAAPCRHNFSLEFQGLPIKVYVQYRRPLLQNWQDIQAKVSEMLLGFKHIPTSADTPQTNSPSTPQSVN